MYPLSTGNDYRISVYYFTKLSLEPVRVARGYSPNIIQLLECFSSYAS